MNELILGISLFCLITLGFVIVYHATKQSLLVWLTLLPCFILTATGLYWYYGGWSSLKSLNTQRLLSQFKTPLAVAQQLKQQLDNTPASAHGWYLLGRVYMSQNHWRQASAAFTKAAHLQPNTALYQVSCLQATLELTNWQFSKKIHNSLQDIITAHPDQPEALALLAMDYYKKQHYKQAIIIWQKLLKKVPSNSETALTLHQAMVAAQNMLDKSNT